MPEETYEDLFFCCVCCKNTIHKVRYNGPEEDSSMSLEECSECHYYRVGLSWELHAPLSEEKDESDN